jgi:hypothetical protein
MSDNVLNPIHDEEEEVTEDTVALSDEMLDGLLTETDEDLENFETDTELADDVEDDGFGGGYRGNEEDGEEAF